MREIEVGQKIKYVPVNIKDGVFSSSNTNIVTVTRDGIVEGVGIGEGVVTYKFTDKYQCEGQSQIEFNVINCDGVETTKTTTYKTPIPVENFITETVQYEMDINKKGGGVKFTTDTHVFVFYDSTSAGLSNLRQIKKSVLNWYREKQPTDIMYEDKEMTKPLSENISDYTDEQIMSSSEYKVNNKPVMVKHELGNASHLHHYSDGKEAFLGLPQRLLSDDSLNEVGVERQGCACHGGTKDQSLFDFIGEDFSNKDVMILAFINDGEIHHYSSAYSTNWGNSYNSKPDYNSDDLFRTWDKAQITEGEIKVDPGVNKQAPELDKGVTDSYYGYKDFYQSFLKIYPLFKSFMGVNYSITDGKDGGARYSLPLVPTYLGIVKGRDYSDLEISELNMNPTLRYQQWENIKGLLKDNIYKNLTDDNGIPGLEKYNWRMQVDKNIGNLPSIDSFPTEINRIIEKVEEGFDTMVTETTTFEWVYNKKVIDFEDSNQTYQYITKEGCCRPLLIEKHEVIPITTYSVDETEIEKIHTIIHKEAYLNEETGEVMERLVSKEVPYIEKHQVAVPKSDTMTITYETTICN
ncbi:MAG: hypothetical protein M0R03_08910 [Novosphingobium sp.]|nr:hypothetical protein [Novosphingobium sp.]